MSLFEEWNRISEGKQNQEEYDEYWNAYFMKEKDAYEKILTEGEYRVAGKLSVLAEELGFTCEEMTGFIDGINTSLKSPLELGDLEEDSEIVLDIEIEKLYFNMHKAEADWLYGLKVWEDILSEEKREEIKRDFNRSKTYKREAVKVGRNDPCPCGSGKKYKKCCGKNK